MVVNTVYGERCHGVTTLQARIEMEQVAWAEAAQQKAQKARQELEADEDYQLQKQRAWDDWKDDNPRGAGNSKLKPTA